MILGISGKKQAGKTTIANIIHGEILLKNNMIKQYDINDKGKLLVKTIDSSGKEGWGEFDIERKDEEFVQYAHYNMWPHVKLYSFADSLKDLCINLFGLTHEQCYGTNEQKNEKLSHIRWENMPGVITNPIRLSSQGGRSSVGKKYEKLVKTLTHHTAGSMTAREFMQFFGTDIMRKIHEDVWTNACLNKVTKEGSELAIISDVRFPNEVKAINKVGGKILRLERNVNDDEHGSETALDLENYDHSNFWHVLDNSEIDISQTVTAIQSLLSIMYCT